MDISVSAVSWLLQMVQQCTVLGLILSIIGEIHTRTK